MSGSDMDLWTTVTPQLPTRNSEEPGRAAAHRPPPECKGRGRRLRVARSVIGCSDPSWPRRGNSPGSLYRRATGKISGCRVAGRSCRSRAASGPYPRRSLADILRATETGFQTYVDGGLNPRLFGGG